MTASGSQARSNLRKPRRDGHKEVNPQQREDSEKGSHQRKQPHNEGFPAACGRTDDEKGDPRQSHNREQRDGEVRDRASSWNLVAELGDANEQKSADDSKPAQPPKRQQQIGQ